MNETTEKVKTRPTSITVICVIGFIGALITVPLIFSSIAQQIGSWYPPYLGFSAVIGLACMVGLWMMRKWAAYTYTGFVVLNQVVLLAMGVWNIMAILIPAVVIFFALKNVSKMT
jgi:glycerol-3-phosphate acyltransferase PlsY